MSKNLLLSLIVNAKVNNAEDLSHLVDEIESAGHSVDTYRKEVNELAKSWDKLNPKEQKQRLEQIKKSLVSLASDTKRTSKNTDKLTKSTKRYSKSLRGLKGKITAVVGAFAGFTIISTIKNKLESLINTGSRFEQLRTQLASLTGSAKNAEGALAWIRAFAKNTPSDIESVTNSFVKMKAFGLDPMDGSYQALIDQTAKLGWSQEKLDGIVLAVGQAWTKQKLQGEEALQLIERGVPVWDLLAKATGKNVVELQKLSSAGELGRKEIRLLIEEMGKQSEGAAKAQMSTWNGLVSNLKDVWLNFQDEVAQAGVMDYFKSQLVELSEHIKKMTKDGTLKQYAHNISNAIVETAKSFKAFAATLIQISPVLKTTAKLFLGFKLGQLAGGAIQAAKAFTGRLIPSITLLRTEGVTAKTAMTALTGAMGGIIGLGVTAAIIGIKTAIDALIPKTEKWEYAVRNAKEALVDLQLKALDGIDLEVNAGSLEQVENAIAEIDSQIANLSEAGTGVIDFAKDWLPIWDSNAEKIVKLSEAKVDLLARQNEVMQTQKRIAQEETENAAKAQVYAKEQKEAARANLALMKERKVSLEKEGKAYGEYYQYVKQQIVELTEVVSGVAPKMTDAFKSVGASINEITTGITGTEQAIIDSFSKDIDYINKISTSAESAGKAIDRYIAKASQEFKTPEGLKAYIAQLEAMPKKSATIQKELDKLKERLNMTNPAFAELASSIQKATNVQQLQQFGEAAKKAFDEGKISAEQYKQALDDIANKSEDIAEKSAQASEKTTTSKQAETQATQENTEAKKENAKKSEEAAKANETMTLSFDGCSAAAQRYTEVLNENMNLIDPAGAWIQAYEAATKVMNNYKREVASSENYMAKLNRKAAEGTLRQSDLAEATQYTANAYTLLDDTQLNKINAEVEKARQKLQSLEDQAKKTAQSIADELANATGSDEDKINLKYQRRKERIHEQDGGAGRAEYQQALRDLEQLRKIEINKLRKRRAEEKHREREQQIKQQPQRGGSQVTPLPKQQLADEFNNSFMNGLNQADLSSFVQQLGDNAGKQLIAQMKEEAKRRAI